MTITSKNAKLNLGIDKDKCNISKAKISNYNGFDIF